MSAASKRYHKQSARIIVVDLASSAFCADTWSILHTSLQNFLSVACTVSGPPRIPFLAIVSVQNQPEIHTPLQNLRTNLPKFQQALNDIQNKVNEPSDPGLNAHDALTAAMTECLSHYNRHQQNLSPHSGQIYPLEMTLVTCARGEEVMKTVNLALKGQSVKKVQILSFAELDEVVMNSQESQHEMCEVIDMETDSILIEGYFKSWLLDNITEEEHVHLLLPANRPGQQLIVKMDVMEKILNPALLPCGNKLCLNPDMMMSRATPAANKQNNHPLRTMKAVKRIAASGICESVVFGLPYQLKATANWKLSWDELEANQQQFNALCQVLSETNECLLVSQSGNRNVQDVRGLFLLLPDTNACSLLIKPIVGNEMLLPSHVPVQNEQVSDVDLDLFKASLEQVDYCDTYNPLHEESGLYQHLVRTHGMNVQKRKSQAPHRPGFAQKTSRRGTADAGAKSTYSGDFQSAANVLYAQKKTRSTKSLYNSLQFPTEL